CLECHAGRQRDSFYQFAANFLSFHGGQAEWLGARDCICRRNETGTPLPGYRTSAAWRGEGSKMADLENPGADSPRCLGAAGLIFREMRFTALRQFMEMDRLRFGFNVGCVEQFAPEKIAVR